MTPRQVGGALGVAVAVLLSAGSAEPGPAPVPEVSIVRATVTIYGAGGSFGSLGDTLPSGQPLARQAIPDWGFPAGRRAGATAVAGDGTVLIAGWDHDTEDGSPTAAGMMIAAYEPDTNAYTTIPVRTSAGLDRVVDGAGRPVAPAVADLTPIAGGTAIAFTAGASHSGQDPAVAGSWPVFGILTEVDGRWQVAPGDGRPNQWTGAQLRASHPSLGPEACPEHPALPGHSDCAGLADLVALPHSRDVIVAQAGSPGVHNGALLALRITGPDDAGRFSVAVTGHYPYPTIRDPRTADPDDTLHITLNNLHADPGGDTGDERFVATLYVTPDAGPDHPHAIQEFRYDAATGAIEPLSAPVIPGERVGTSGRFFGYSAAIYDSAGNLWAARHNWLAGGKLAVYAASPRRHPLGASPQCRYERGRSMGSYRTTGGGTTVWGRACRPDYDILQGQPLLGVPRMAQDPESRAVVLLTLYGSMLVVRSSGHGADMTFEVGNPVDTAPTLLPTPAGQLAAHRIGMVDAGGRVWFSVMQSPQGVVGLQTDQWLFAVELADLFDPEPVPAPGIPGQVVTVEAGHTTTTGTAGRRGSWATVDVDSEAFFTPCTDLQRSTGCGYDGTPGDGFTLSDHTGFGHLGGPVDYRVDVPAAGDYRVAYRVATFPVTTGARIELTAGGRTYPTAVSTDGHWRTVALSEPVSLPAGVQTIRLSAPPDGRGWYLKSFTLQRG